MSENLSIYGTLLLSGLVGSLGHCLGMCGPLVIMVGYQLKPRGVALLPYYLLYHGARIAVYSVLGIIGGLIGSMLGLGDHLGRFGGIISLALGIFTVLFGLSYLGWLPILRTVNPGQRLNHVMGAALRRGGVWGVALLGALNGLLPCGLVYGALLVAVAMGSPLAGGLGMLVFGAGTIPVLLILGVGVTSLSPRTRQTFARLAGILIVIVGVQLALRGLAGMSMLPHLRLGEVMLW
jgi:sulfite exporter TauE/SafE